MKKLRIYVDTSVLGGCFDAEFATWSNGLMEDFRAGTFQPVISDVVASEVHLAPEVVRRQYAELLTLGATRLIVTDEVLALLGSYELRSVLPERHVAYCAGDDCERRCARQLELQAYRAP